MGFQYPPFQNPQKTHQLEESTTSCAQYDPVEVIAGLRCAPLETEQKKHQGTATKQQLKNICVHAACAPAPGKPQAMCHFSSETFRKKSNNQKVFDVSIFSTFRSFDFSIFSIFSTFRFFEQTKILNCKLFEFSTFRGRKSWVSRSDRYQPEEHTAQIRVPPNVTVRNFIFPTI